MALAVTIAFLILLVLLACATMTPWPFEVAVVSVGLVCVGSAAVVSRDVFLSVGIGALPVLSLLALKTIVETFAALGNAPRQPARTRRAEPEAERLRRAA